MSSSVTFTCSNCNNEYVKGKTDAEVIQTFKKWYPKADITSAKLVCEKCYGIALRMLEIKQQQQNWINYAMSN